MALQQPQISLALKDIFSFLFAYMIYDMIRFTSSSTIHASTIPVPCQYTINTVAHQMKANEVRTKIKLYK